MNNVKNSDYRLDIFAYIFLALVIASSGFEHFYRDTLFINFACLLVISLGVYNKIKLELSVFYIVVPFCAVIALQAMHFGAPTNQFFGFAVKVVAFFYATKLFGPALIVKFVNIVYTISIASLVFYLGGIISPIDDILVGFVNSIGGAFGTDGYTPSVVIHNYMYFTDGMLRNPGPFFEPGMYAVYLCLALYFVMLGHEKVNYRYTLIFILTLATTQSTAGVLVAIMLVGIVLLKPKIQNLVFFSIFLVFAFYVLDSSLISGKFAARFDDMYTVEGSRFNSVLVLLDIIYDNPLIGAASGINHSFILENYTSASRVPNGLLIVFIAYGVPVGILFYGLLCSSLVNIVSYLRRDTSVYYGLSLWLGCLALAFSQDYATRPFGLFLIVFGLYVGRRNRSRS